MAMDPVCGREMDEAACEGGDRSDEIWGDGG